VDLRVHVDRDARYWLVVAFEPGEPAGAAREVVVRGDQDLGTEAWTKAGELAAIFKVDLGQEKAEPISSTLVGDEYANRADERLNAPFKRGSDEG
jgi:hypothetical protein